MKTEKELYAAVKKLIPGAKPIENAVGVGMPDVILPTSRGWRFVELKLLYADYLWFRRSQLPFLTETSKLSRPCRVLVLVGRKEDDLVTGYWDNEIVAYNRDSPKPNKVRVFVQPRAFIELDVFLRKIAYLHC